MIKMSRRNLLRGCSAAAMTLAVDPSLAVAQTVLPDAFIEQLIARMSLEEKAGQLSI